MLHWRRLMVGERVFVEDALGRQYEAVITAVPVHRRDTSGSHATTVNGLFPVAWVQIGNDVIPWPCDAIRYPTEAD